jgi:hypothetical protein
MARQSREQIQLRRWDANEPEVVPRILHLCRTAGGLRPGVGTHALEARLINRNLNGGSV